MGKQKIPKKMSQENIHSHVEFILECTEIEIANIADITVVVFNPYTGDSIQTIKAGITEIGDIYLVHKSDLDGASQLFQSVQDFIGTVEKNPIILKVSSKTEKGISEFIKELEKLMTKKKRIKNHQKNRNLPKNLMALF